MRRRPPSPGRWLSSSCRAASKVGWRVGDWRRCGLGHGKRLREKAKNTPSCGLIGQFGYTETPRSGAFPLFVSGFRVFAGGWESCPTSRAVSQLAPGVSQFPVDWYFDEKLFELEKKLIFDAGPGYVGHELMVPEAVQLPFAGMARPLAACWCGSRTASTTCRTSAAIARPSCCRAPAPRSNIVCPIHRWTYDTAGRTDRRAAFSRQSLPEPAQAQARILERPAVQGAALGQRRPGRHERGRANSISPATSSTTSSCTSATTTGRPSSRSISRTTTSCPTIRAWATSSPATT